MRIESRTVTPTKAGRVVEVVGSHGPLTVAVVIRDEGLVDVLPTGDGTQGGRLSATLDRTTLLAQVRRLVHGTAEAAYASVRSEVTTERPMADVTDAPPADEAYAGYQGAGGLAADPPLPTWRRIA